MFALTNSNGMLTFNVPDVCKTPAPPAPPVPLPYPNMSQCTLFSPGSLSKKVTIVNGMAATVRSETTLSNGDEPGVAGGVKSNCIVGKAAFILGSNKVRLEGKAAVFMGNPTTHNKENTIGTAALPSQSKVSIGG